MRLVQLLPEAEEELVTAASHYERQQAGLGLSLIQQIRKACDQISERPLAIDWFAARSDARSLAVSLIRFSTGWTKMKSLSLQLPISAGGLVIGVVECSRLTSRWSEHAG